jgi:hypothetical protein
VITTNSIAKCEKPIAFAIVLLLDLSDEKYEKSPFAYIIFKIRIFNKYLHVRFFQKCPRFDLEHLPKESKQRHSFSQPTILRK